MALLEEEEVATHQEEEVAHQEAAHQEAHQGEANQQEEPHNKQHTNLERMERSREHPQSLS